MTCCLPPPEFVEAAAGPLKSGPSEDEIRLASRDIGGGLRQTDLAVPDIHCGACVSAIEKTVARLAGVHDVRVNLSARRASIRWQDAPRPPDFARAIADLGYRAHLWEAGEATKDPRLAAMLRALAVAAFCSMNIMMLSGSVWSGADGPTRTLLHWFCAGLALPALLYAGRVFYESAWNAIRHGRTNMDVPITIGIFLAFGLSLYDTVTDGHQVYFDAVASLILFLLIGRTLDHVMRNRARTAVLGLARIVPRGAFVVNADDTTTYLPLGEIEAGARLLVRPGDRVPLDMEVIKGSSAVDRSLISGESEPVIVGPGARVEAGALNLHGALTARALANGSASTLSEMLRLLEAAESGKGIYRSIADRAAALYAPVVHLSALAVFAFWYWSTANFHEAVTTAIAVLIITCPCALGLAVPMVQTVAARRLFDRGIMVKDGSSIERLAQVDRVVFDKTGTLTSPHAALEVSGGDAGALSMVRSLAAHSSHPSSRTLAEMTASAPLRDLGNLTEIPGNGIEATHEGSRYRLGRAGWAAPDAAGHGTVLARDGRILARFELADRLLPGAVEAARALGRAGVAIEIISGDSEAKVAAAAAQLGIAEHRALALPRDKIAAVEALQRGGHRVLMVGDGINDAAALTAAHVSMAPAEAAEIGRNAADFVFLRNDLRAVPYALEIARRAARLVRQNLGIALVYNVVALPAAAMGLVTPFWAAIAMSASSIVVVLNALRLGSGGPPFGPLGRRAGQLRAA